MNKGSTLFVSPYLPPYRSGLSDYSFQFSNELKKHTRVEFLFGSDPGDWKGLKLLLRFLRLIRSDADTVLIQYVPYMYGKRGINLQFPILLFVYSLFKRKKIELMVHEYNYPYLGNLKSLILFSLHNLMGKLMLLSSDQVFCSTESFVELLGPKSLNPVSHLPVGSNILKDDISEHMLQKLNLKAGEYVCLFGSFHSSKRNELILEALESLDIQVVHIGVTENDYQKIKYNGSLNIVKTGFLEDREVAEILSNCKVLLTYFIDGATLRRGSLLAGVELGCQVLTNYSSHTEKELLSCKNIHFTKTIEEYSESLKALVQGDFGRSEEGNPFSWGRIISDYLSRCVGR